MRLWGRDRTTREPKSKGAGGPPVVCGSGGGGGDDRSGCTDVVVTMAM